MDPLKIALDYDETGAALSDIGAFLRAGGFDVHELGANAPLGRIYPDIALGVARRVASGEFHRGILVCGTGMGMAIVANKVPGIFAAVCRDQFDAAELASARCGNVIALGVDHLDLRTATKIVGLWLSVDAANRPTTQRLRAIDRELRPDH